MTNKPAFPCHLSCEMNGCQSLHHFICPGECAILRTPPEAEPEDLDASRQLAFDFYREGDIR